ncbi:pyridoxamine 5'-phosphate oxidase family protein [Bacillus sp. FJAT-45350]|uniref:pyridoxamine 5'-phosphate oxidase family protein n=1 Tax=Bacillus sp. FJAT-45350 TaxID=2011014 RepID=UPI000BB900E2|nr:pyridoxamine 5'-phosphate oxidase family protein [Bacillus sp. FJAT-45350]
MSKNEPITTLSQELQDKLNDEALILISTIDETNTPNVSAISWVKAVSESKLRFTVTNNSRIVSNIQHNNKVVLNLIGLGNVYSIQGTCNILEDVMDGVAMKLSKIEVDIDQVFESMFWGAEIVQEPKYNKTYNPEKAKELDVQVYAALLK